MDILFVHHNFPAQFVHVARALQRRPGLRLAVITHNGNQNPDFLPTVRYGWETAKAGSPDPIAANYTLHASRGRVAAHAMAALRDKGFNPSIIVGHLGWGETLFVKDVFPEAKLVVYAEFFYSAEGADVGFDPEFPEFAKLDQRFRLRAKNASILAAMHEADVGVAPTLWQASRLPPYLQSKLAIIHEGIDTDIVRPNAAATYSVPGANLTFSGGDEVITFVNRNLEPYRGYHIFMRALPAVLQARPRAHVVIVGGDSVSYGAPPPPGQTWKEIFLAEVRERLPMDRVHFVGKIPFPHFVSLMQISSAHVYLTYPFVLSWSMLQAMSAGAPLIASKTAPVVEVVDDGVNGVLTDFFAVDELVERVIDVLAHPDNYRGMREAARKTIAEKYDLTRICLPKWLNLLGGLAPKTQP